MRAGSCSGGMKRRLSVAVALIGDPNLVILDEPTAGMDLITRRHIWNIIENAKKGRAIILTTHSTEEADILGDPIGIMAQGSLRCIGTSIKLKSKLGTGFVVNVSFTDSNFNQNHFIGDAFATASHDAVKQFLKKIPTAAKFIGIPGTKAPENPRGTMAEVYREADESGNLCISGRSPEHPVPSNITLTENSDVNFQHKPFSFS